MTTVLVVTSSALGDASASNQLVLGAVAAVRAADPTARVVTRDLGTEPVPHLGLDAATALRAPRPMNAAQAAARALSDELIAELEAADVVVIGAPMYNFGIPSTLKAWFDHALRAGSTFRYGEAGPEGLLTGKRAVVVETRGGLYSAGPARAMNSQEPHLRTLLGFIGITDVTFVRAEQLAMGESERDHAMAAARAELETIVEDAWRQAA